ncbi:hypothetical protein [Sphingomonas sp.]|uniref:DUF4139 domain-containing protein n=1 Tax=Sphingomonas sp. TaxID=28214 RepID=UPI00286D22D3|nr:hypothetical protein [Sphingomonas sp.]
MRRFVLGLMLAALPSLAPMPVGAQAIVISPRPDKVAVTVYRDPNGSSAMELGWLGGFALVTETRRVTLPAGEVDLRFEGVAGGLIPQSAVVSGLGDGVTEKNRDAKLLSPGTLIDAYLGQRVHLRRTSKATGKVTEQEAIVRASGSGIVVQTESGIEALRCTGLNETLLAPRVPADLSARPTLSVRARSAQPVEADVTLTYLTSNFDWRAHYVATLAPDGKTLALFAWLTLANGDDTGFVNADTMAVAGRLNREQVERMQPEVRSIAISCWPSRRTHQTGIPPPPAPEFKRDRDEAIVITGSRMTMAESPSPVTAVSAAQENLGDLKLYRIPIPVTVAAHSQKQVALLKQPSAKIVSKYRWDTRFANQTDGPRPAQRLLKLDNRKAAGLGLPLPAGSFTLYTMRDGQPFLLGEGAMTDRAIGEMVDVVLADTPGVEIEQRQLEAVGNVRETILIATNDQSIAAPLEVRFGDDAKPLKTKSGSVKRRDGTWVWEVVVPANSSRELTVRHAND